MQPQEPLITWNLFLTIFLVPLCVGALGMYINRWLKQSDARRDRKEAEYIAYRERKEKQIADLLAEKEAQKEAEIKEWRTTYTANQCAIKNAITEIKEKMLVDLGERLHQIDTNKVDWDAWRTKEEACKREHIRIDDRFMAWDK